MKGGLSIALVLGILVAFLLEEWILGPFRIQEQRDLLSSLPEEIKETNQEKEVRAQVRLKPIVEATKQPKQASRPSKAFQEVAVSRELLDRGRALMEEGRFPGLTAYYNRTIGFSRYAEAMIQLGGRLFVRDMDALELRAEVDLVRNRLLPVDRRSLAHLSPRSRDLSDEPALQRFVIKAESAYGSARYSIILLVPIQVDAFLTAGMEEGLSRLGLSLDNFISFEGQYQGQGGDLVLKILFGMTRAGEKVPLRLAFNFSAAARAGRS